MRVRTLILMMLAAGAAGVLAACDSPPDGSPTAPTAALTGSSDAVLEAKGGNPGPPGGGGGGGGGGDVTRVSVSGVVAIPWIDVSGGDSDTGSNLKARLTTSQPMTINLLNCEADSGNVPDGSPAVHEMLEGATITGRATIETDKSTNGSYPSARVAIRDAQVSNPGGAFDGETVGINLSWDHATSQGELIETVTPTDTIVTIHDTWLYVSTSLGGAPCLRAGDFTVRICHGAGCMAVPAD